MIKNITNFGLLSLLAFAIFSCSSTMQNNSSNNRDINSVSYSKTLGRAGFLNIVATRDSLISTKFGGAFNDIPELKQKISSKDWSKIVSAIDLDMVKITKSGDGRGYYDGPDETFEIITTDKKYTLMNVADSTKYKQLGHLKDIIKKIAASQK